MILVTGANGTTGRELVKLLSSMKIPTRAMIRDKSRAAGLDLPYIEVVCADLSKPETLNEVLEGVERAYLVSTADPQIVRLHKNFIEAAKKAGVKHIVRHSAMGADLGSTVSLTRNHAACERILEESGIGWTHIRPAFFMQNFLNMFLPGICEEGCLKAPLGDGRIGMIDARDIARVAANVLTTGGHSGKIYELTGPEALSFYDCAAALSRVMDLDISYVNVKPEEALRDMIEGGLPQWLASDMVGLYGMFRRGAGERLTTAVPDITGRGGYPFEDFLRDYAESFVCKVAA